MTESEALEILTRDDAEIREGFFCINDILAIEVAKKSLEEVQEFEAIGTVSEFRQLKEKATAKKPRFYAHNYHCTECGNLVGNNEFHWQRFEYCDKCGQKLDWSEGKE